MKVHFSFFRFAFLFLFGSIVCYSSSFGQSQTVSVISGGFVAESETDVMIHSYPNPVETELTLEVANNFNLERLQFFTLQGELVAEFTVDENSLPGSIPLALEAGAYQVRGIGAFFGKVNWGLAVTVGIGIILIAGATSIAG